MDADPQNADWIKAGTWDLPRDEAALRAWLASKGASVEQFKTLPIYRWHVDDPDLPWLKTL